MEDIWFVVVVMTRDSVLAEDVVAVTRAGGGRAVVVEGAEALEETVSQEFPVLILVDGTTPTDWRGAIRHCKLRPQTKQIPIHLIVGQADGTLRQAREQLGVDAVWARAPFVAELPQIIDQHLHPPTIYPAGWDAPLSDLARQGLAEFNRRDYFEQHEYLEAAWVAETRPIREMYQGILQVGLAFLQIERNNWRGALKMFRRGLPKLRGLPDTCQGIALAPFRNAAEQIHAEIATLGPGRLAEFDQRRFPQIGYR